MAKLLFPFKRFSPWLGRVILLFLLVLVGLGLLLHWFDGWRLVLVAWLLAAGMPGFFVFSVIYNVFLVPFPYDPFLWMMPVGEGWERLGWWACATAALTLAAGIDCLLGRRLAPRVRPWLARQRGYARCERLLARHGVWAVGLSAVTPLPFSLVCWVAGLVGVRLRWVLLMALVSRGLRHAAVLGLAGLTF